MFEFKRPKLKEYVNILRTNENEFQVRIGENDFLYRMKGKAIHLVQKVIPYLNGKNTISSIIRKTHVKKDILSSILNKLDTFLIEGNIAEKIKYSKYKNQINFFSLWSKEPTKLQMLIKKTSICVVNNCNLTKEIIISLFSSGFRNIYILKTLNAFKKQNYLRVTKKDNNIKFRRVDSLSSVKLIKRIRLFILSLQSYDLNFCEEVNKFAVSFEKPYLLVRHNGVNDSTVGPMVVPFLTSCYKCYELRIKANTDFYEEYEAYENFVKSKKNVSMIPSLFITNRLLSSLATIEVIKYITGFESPVIYGRFLAIDQINCRFQFHDVLKLPRCPVCGKEDKAFKLPWLEVAPRSNFD